MTILTRFNTVPPMNLYTDPVTRSETPKNTEIKSIVNEPLSKIFFDRLSGVLGSVPFVKFVIDRENGNTIHFLNDRFYHLHAYYVCDNILKESQNTFLKKIDAFNEETYHSPALRFYFLKIGVMNIVFFCLFFM